METFYDCPNAMKEQVSSGKKDKYIEIVDCLLSVSEDLFFDENREYALTLKAVLEIMDFQIYELYRALADKYVSILKKLFEAGEEEYFSTAEWNDLIKFGEEKDFLLREWFAKEDDYCALDVHNNLEISILFKSARSVCFEICGAGKYETDKEYVVSLNGRVVECMPTTVKSIYGLLPDREYCISVMSADGSLSGSAKFTTLKESVTLNVKAFGAIGDGIKDDTHAIQTAIMNCPKEGRVLIPEGKYLIKSLFLKSNISIELSKGSEIVSLAVREERGFMPGVLPSTDGSKDYYFGTWEGNPLPMFAGIVSGVEVENVIIYGEGILNGGASKEDWWSDPKTMKLAYRPRLFFIRDCNNIVLQGITLMNSPSWTIHPFFSDNLGFYNITVKNPSDSPNTDGLDPESCKNIEIAGVKFSLGDDCIAVKSGKIFMGKKYKTPSENIRIHNCLMENGHGAVTVGSEMAGGVKDLIVENCNFSHTDRGLRVKTRRGRGEDAILDNIIFRNIDMDHVMTPFVVNSFYFCDPDGRTPYVQSREAYPVDDRTPQIKTLKFENIVAKNCHVAAAYIEGLTERKIENLEMRNITVSYAENPKCDVPAMSEGIEKCSLRGVIIKRVENVILENVSIEGNVGEKIVLEDTGR